MKHAVATGHYRTWWLRNRWLNAKVRKTFIQQCPSESNPLGAKVWYVRFKGTRRRDRPLFFPTFQLAVDFVLQGGKK